MSLYTGRCRHFRQSGPALFRCLYNEGHPPGAPHAYGDDGWPGDLPPGAVVHPTLTPSAVGAIPARRVVIESPYAGDLDTNLRYLRAALHDALERGEAPFASHALYTQPGVLDDTVPGERDKGIRAGYVWWDAADAIVFYIDRGWSKGMLAAKSLAEALNMRVEERMIPGWR